MKNLYKLTILLIALTFNVSLVLAQTATAPAVGDGTSENPYQIVSLENLYWITASDAVVPSPNQVTRWTKYYIQTADINASATSSWNSGAGWSPIGNGTTSFTGSYNGQGHTINGLYINRWADYQSLFGAISSVTAKIDNLGVTNVNVFGVQYVGGLAGFSRYSAAITNCYTTGSVSGRYFLSGLVGYNSNSATISNCYSGCSVSGVYYQVGGLVGYNNQSATIINSYSTGSVSGQINVGGLVGYNTASAIVSKCYSTGSVNGTVSDFGGLVGNNSSSVINSFWDTQTSGQATSSGGTGKTTLEMKDQSTFLNASWDSNVWNIGDGINSGYPYLDWQNPSGTPLPVELTSFSASVNGGSVVLNWQTATEVNNYGFEIEKAVSSGQSAVGDGSLSWSKCGFVEGNGNSNSPKVYSFTDKSTTSGKYVYRLKQIDNDGKYEYSKEIEIDVDKIPTVFALAQNYPNPFNPATVISFQLPVDSKVQLKIYDVVGSEVATLVNEERPAGIHHVEFNAGGLASGIYFYELRSGDFVSTKKLMLMK